MFFLRLTQYCHQWNSLDGSRQGSNRLIERTHTFKMADIYDKILIFSCSGGYKNLKFVENCVILWRLNKLNPIFNLEKSYFFVEIIVF